MHRLESGRRSAARLPSTSPAGTSHLAGTAAVSTSEGAAFTRAEGAFLGARGKRPGAPQLRRAGSLQVGRYGLWLANHLCSGRDSGRDRSSRWGASRDAAKPYL